MRTEAAHKPKIAAVQPNAAIAGGEFFVRGDGFFATGSPAVTVGGEPAQLIVAGGGLLIAKVPDSATVGDIVVSNGTAQSKGWPAHVGIQIADSLHPVANPAVDADGNIFSTFSGSRGQKSPVSIYKIDTNFTSRPFVTDLMNPTGLAFDRSGLLYVSSRYEGIIYQVTPTGNMSVYVEGMGVATGLAFDSEENLYVGDRSGTIFKISRTRQIYVFATLEPSIAAYHLAFDANDILYVTGPTTSSFDAVHRISRAGEVDMLYRGLGRPQGLAFDAEGRLYVAASFRGRRGVVRFPGEGDPEIFVSGPGIVGLAFSPTQDLIVSTQNSLYRLDVEQPGKPLP
jgi:sugar lactone lactonase YvrE